MKTVTFFTKDGCTLCESAWFVINKLRQRIDFEIERVDITEPQNTRWYALYCNDIPVVHLNGEEVCRHRVSERTLRRLLESANA
ncbi:MAG: glutaredoxin family protein [Phycisphaerae bacterium]